MSPDTSTTTEFTARHRFARITARKARRVADMIRGRSVNEALELLQFAPQRGAAFYLKVVRSAVANASHDENVNINRLYVHDCRADDGPLLNDRMRFRPGPQGRAMPFAKRLSHLTVKVRELPDEERRLRRSKAASAASAAPAANVEKPQESAESAAAKKKPAKKKAAGKKTTEAEKEGN
jgi:large subunit ribosomal protein L22